MSLSFSRLGDLKLPERRGLHFKALGSGMPSFISLATWSLVLLLPVVGRDLIPEGILQRLVLEDLSIAVAKRVAAFCP